MTRYGLIARLVAGSLVIAGPMLAQTPTAPAPKVELDKPAYGAWGFDQAGMDTTVKAGEDFGRYANGTYLKNLVIPQDRSRFGMFIKLRDLSQERTRGIVEAAAALKDAKPGSEDQKVGDFYGSFMDEAAIEAKGLAPLKHYLDHVAGISNRTQLAKAFGSKVIVTVGSKDKADACLKLSISFCSLQTAFSVVQGKWQMTDR